MRKIMYTIPPTLKQEISEYKDLIDDYRSGRVESVKFKSIRVPMGIYEQRENDTYMVRVRCTGGFMTPHQLKQVARIARRHNAGYIHITTRQELQIQDVELEDTGKILEQLHENGLSSRGGGGNTVRNIMASC
jgi:sulfite reductase (ferredoxin)